MGTDNRRRLVEEYSQLLPKYDEISERQKFIFKISKPFRQATLFFAVLCLITAFQFPFTGEIFKFQWIVILTVFLTFSLILLTKSLLNTGLICDVQHEEKLREIMRDIRFTAYGVSEARKEINPETAKETVKIIGDIPIGRTYKSLGIIYKAALIVGSVSTALMIYFFAVDNLLSNAVAVIVGASMFTALKAKVKIEGLNIRVIPKIDKEK